MPLKVLRALIASRAIKHVAAASAFGLGIPVAAQTPAIPVETVSLGDATTPPVPLPSLGVPAGFTIDRIEGAEQNPTFIALSGRQDCGPSSPTEIVVCARRDTKRYRLRAVPPVVPPPLSMDDLQQALSGTIAGVAVSPGTDGGSVGITFFGSPAYKPGDAVNPGSVVNPRCKQLAIGSKRCL